MSNLDHKTLDLASVLSGIGFPEDDVEVYFDESIGYEVYKAEQTLHLTEIRGNEEELRSLAEKLDDLKRKARDSVFTVTVRGIPEATRRACDKKARDKFPVSYSFLGQAEPDPERDDYYNALIWAASIVKVTDSEGRVAVPTEQDIVDLRSKVGRSFISTITKALDELVSGVSEGLESSKGFEQEVQDVDFLSGASQEV